MLQEYAEGGYLLIATTALALIAANTSLDTLYFSIWNHPLSLKIGGFELLAHHGNPITVMAFINDAFMALFFLSVGLEIKREILVGELSSIKKSLLPLFASAGGVIVPILIFILIASGADEMRGAAIPMATDIAFALGILSMFGKRVPIGLKIFLATLAVADDLFGIVTIALFYTETVYFQYLIYAAILLLAMLLLNRLRIYKKSLYLVIGIVIWFMFLNSGIHPTIAGVLIALCIPAKPLIDTRKYMKDICSTVAMFNKEEEMNSKKNQTMLTQYQVNMLNNVNQASKKVISPLQDMENLLHPIVSLIIIPIFAFANAGISLKGITFSTLAEGVTPAIILGLLVGKFVGISLFSWIAIKLKLTKLPTGVTWKPLLGVAILGGIGFTVSLFISTLSYGADNIELLNQAKVGVVVGSLIAGVLGYIVLKFTLPKHTKQDEN